MPWVDLDGNPITDTRSYPTAKDTDAGIEVRLGEQQWLLAEEPTSERDPPPFSFYLPRSDGGVVVLRFTATAVELLELLPDGTIAHYDITETPVAILPSAIMPDGSVMAIHNLQLVRLAPGA